LFGHATSGYTVIGRRRSKAGLLSKEDVIGSVSSTDQGGGKRRSVTEASSGRNSQLEILKKIALGTEGSCCPYREGDSPRLLPRPLLEKH
jgi:hypothetical protein